jgi:hypothetical protein
MRDHKSSSMDAVDPAVLAEKSAKNALLFLIV